MEDNDYIQVGFNFRMPTMLAAIRISQLNHLQEIIDIRRSHAHYLTNHLSKIDGIITPKELDGRYQVYQMYTIQLEDEKTRNALQKHMADNGIISKVYFNPVHLKTLYTKNYRYKEGDLPKTEVLSNRVLNILLFTTLKKEDLDYIIKTIHNFSQEMKQLTKTEKNIMEEARQFPTDYSL